MNSTRRICVEPPTVCAYAKGRAAISLSYFTVPTIRFEILYVFLVLWVLKPITTSLPSQWFVT